MKPLLIAFALVPVLTSCIVFTDTSEFQARDADNDTDTTDVAGDTSVDAVDAIDAADVPPDVDISGPQDPCAGRDWCDPVNDLRITCEGGAVAYSCPFGCDDGLCQETCTNAGAGCSDDSTTIVECVDGNPEPDDMCSDGFMCVAGGCRGTDECEPGGSVCVDGGIQVCDQTGAVSAFVPCDDAACTAVWPDLDGDGWGDGFQRRGHACGVPENTASNDLDCDDFAPSGPETPCVGWVVVAPDRFVMGTPPGEIEVVPDAETQQLVDITRRILVMETEVTQAEWTARSEAIGNPSEFDCEDCPVENVNWFEALNYANVLSRNEGLDACYTLGECHGGYGNGCNGDDCDAYVCDRVTFAGLDCPGYRLPAEFEWEYFTRAGSTGAYSATLETLGWVRANTGGDSTRPVAGLAANDFGVFDVHGNVSEWVMDILQPYRGNLETPTEDPLEWGSPTDVSNLEVRVIRGGAYNSVASAARSGARGVLNPQSRVPSVGFRLVRTFVADASLDASR